MYIVYCINIHIICNIYIPTYIDKYTYPIMYPHWKQVHYTTCVLLSDSMTHSIHA